MRPRGFMIAVAIAGATATGIAVTGGLAVTGQRGDDDTPAPVVTTVSTTTTVATATTTTVASFVAPSTVPDGPGRCPALDAAIVDGLASIEPNRGNFDDTIVRLVVHTTGTVDRVTAHIGSGRADVTENNEFDLLEQGEGTWIAHVPLPNGAERGGEMMLFTATGCGFDELDVNMTRLLTLTVTPCATAAPWC